MQNDENRTLGAFYASRCGRSVAAQLSAFIESRWPSAEGRRILTLGYATPFCSVLERKKPQVIIEADPTDTKETRSALKVSPLSLPFPDASFHAVLAVNVLERLLQPEMLLKEVRRILINGGSVICITPNKYSLWGVRRDAPPMRNRLFSAKEAAEMLNANLLNVTYQKSAVFLPPAAYTRNVAMLDEFMSYLPLSAGAFVLTEARKQAVALPQKIKEKNYKSARITKASIFSSPRS